MSNLTPKQRKIIKKAWKLGHQAGELALKQQEAAKEFEAELEKIFDSDVVSELPALCDPICDLLDHGCEMTLEEFENIIHAAIIEEPNELLRSGELKY